MPLKVQIDQNLRSLESKTKRSFWADFTFFNFLQEKVKCCWKDFCRLLLFAFWGPQILTSYNFLGYFLKAETENFKNGLKIALQGQTRVEILV